MSNASERQIDAIRRFYATGPAIDDSGRSVLAEPDIVWHVPGNNHVSGDYRGIAEVFTEMSARMQPLDEWEIEVNDIMANRDLVVGVVALRARRGEHKVDCRGAHVFRFSDQGLIAEAWGFVADQARLDDMLQS